MTVPALDLLYVEDNEDDAFLFREVLEKTRYARLLGVARDGEEAIQFLRREGPHAKAGTPNLIVLDIRMPKADGFEVLRQLKGDPRYRHIPVAILTTSSREEDMVRSYEQGVVSYLVKPTRLTDLEWMVKKFLEYWSRVSRVPGNGHRGGKMGRKLSS
ncbi:MAG: response regulator [Nitrospirae bacterium]|nr:response regulator [Nitrospirota bacterium]